MSGFRGFLQNGAYSAGFTSSEDTTEVRPVTPIRAEEASGMTAADVLSRFGGEQPHDKATSVADGGIPEGGESEEEVDLEAMIAEAVERGRREAREELADAIRGYEVSKNRLEEILTSVDSCREGWAHQLRLVTGDLVLQTIERLVSEVPELLDEHLRKGCELAVEQMVNAQRVDVIVHPDDLGLAEDLIGERDGWAVLTDDGIRGGCVVEAPSGKLDASLDAALEGITAAIDAWKEETAPQPEPEA
jgi:flagellar biosynthesis/type III secretory pathway protein FliH